MPKARILAVDDQRYFREFIEDLLTPGGLRGPDRVERRGGAPPPRARRLRRRAHRPRDARAWTARELVAAREGARPEQDIVVVTGVVDVKTAVDAMKLGATDYLLKPFDRTRARARPRGHPPAPPAARGARPPDGREHRVHGRALALRARARRCSRRSPSSRSPTASSRASASRPTRRAACSGSRATTSPSQLRLAGVRGLVRARRGARGARARVAAARARAARRAAPPLVLRAAGAATPEEAERPTAPRAALWVPLRRGAQLLGVARLTDRLDGGDFGDDQRAAAEKFAGSPPQALDNALRFRALERRSFRDPVTEPTRGAYFDDVVRNEIHKAARFGRTFSLVRVELEGLGELRARALRGRVRRPGSSRCAFHVGRALRATDLLAAESESRFCVLLPETDALGAAVLKRRIRAALERSEPWRALEPAERPELLLGAATFPTDGTQLEALWSVLEGARRRGPRAAWCAPSSSRRCRFRGLVDALLAEGIAGRPETGEQMTALRDRRGRAPPARARPPLRRARAPAGRRAARRARDAARPRAAHRDRARRRAQGRAGLGPAGHLGLAAPGRHPGAVPDLLRRGLALRAGARARRARTAA